MKKKFIVFLILANLLLTPTVLAQPKRAIICTHDIKFNGDLAIWHGTVTFPNEDVYDLIWYIDLTPEFVGHKKSPVFPDGKVEKFSETWELYIPGGFDHEDPDLGDLIPADLVAAGWDKGVFSADSWKYVMNGAVTSVKTGGPLEYLEGARMKASGVAELSDTFYGEGLFWFSGYANARARGL
jgi:hypothetical protein